MAGGWWGEDGEMVRVWCGILSGGGIGTGFVISLVGWVDGGREMERRWWGRLFFASKIKMIRELVGEQSKMKVYRGNKPGRKLVATCACKSCANFSVR